MVSVKKMTILYDAQYSIVLLRPNNEVKPLTHSAEKWICSGKWPVSSLAECIRHVLVVPCVLRSLFCPNADGALVLGTLNSSTKRPGGGDETIQKLEFRGPIFADFRPFGPSF